MNDYQSLCFNQRRDNSVNTQIFMIKDSWKVGLVALGWGALERLREDSQVSEAILGSRAKLE